MANVSNPESRGYSSAEAHISRVETHKSLIVDALTKLDVRSGGRKASRLGRQCRFGFHRRPA